MGRKRRLKRTRLEQPSNLTIPEQALIELTGERGRRVDVPGVCIEHPRYLQLQRKGLVKTDSPIVHGKILYWELTEKGKKEYVRMLKRGMADG